MKALKEYAPLVFFGVFLTIVFIAMSAEAQSPDPDEPFVPYTHSDNLPQWPPDKHKPPLKLVEAGNDFELPPDTCVKEVIVEEFTMLHGYCERDIPTEYNPSHTQAVWMALPPGCMMVLITQKEKIFDDGVKGLVKNYQYNQDPECWILFKNIRYIEDEDGLIGA